MSEDTPIDLPVGLRWVKLVCRLGMLVTDSAYDADPHPDLLPVRGTLTLTTSPSRLRVQEADGRWRSVEAAGREYNVRADGELVDDQGRVGVWMPDPTSLLVEPQGYAVTAAVKPTGGTGWSVTIGGSTVLPDVVDLVAVSSVGPVSPDVTASFDARLYALEQGGGVDVSQAVEDYLTTNPPPAAPDATTAAKGLVRLAGDLAGTADAPTVPGLAGKSDAGHGHAIGDVSGLQTALDGKQASGSYAAATHTHTAAQISDATTTGRALMTATSSAAGQTTLGIYTASTAGAGLVELATTTETTTGTDTARAVTPAGLKAVADTKAPASHDHTAADIDSGAALDGHILTADGAGGAAWEAPPAGGGGADPWTYVVATADTTNNTNIAANVSGMSIPVLADGLYEWEAVIRYAGDNGTIGAWIGLAAAPAGATVTAWGIGPNTNYATVFVHFPNSAQSIEVQTSSSAGNLGWPQIVRMGGTIRAASMAGAVSLTLRNESGSAVVSVKADSFIRYRRIAD